MKNKSDVETRYHNNTARDRNCEQWTAPQLNVIKSVGPHAESVLGACKMDGEGEGVNGVNEGCFLMICTDCNAMGAS